MFSDPVSYFIFELSVLIFAIAIVLLVLRLWKGPDDLDRVVALECFAGLSMFGSVLMSLYYRQWIYLDVALAIAALGFISSSVWSLWFEKEIT